MAVQMANGGPNSHFIEGIDVNDPDYIKQLLRPPVIKEDVKLMQQRARVSLILRSPFFRRELEKIVASQMQDGCLNANIAALKHILDYLTPHTKFGSSTFTKGATMPVLPINDLKGVKPTNYLKGERLLRCKIASVYRLVELCGWNRGMHCHITARVTRDSDEYLINPLGLLYHEVTASSLAKVDLKGTILDPGTVALGIDRQGWMLHSAVHAARPSVRCIIHLNTPATIAVSGTKTGLLPLSQEAMIIGGAIIYDPSTVAMSSAQSDPAEGDDDATTRRKRRFDAERAAIAAVLQEHPDDRMVMLIRNHGLLAMGHTVEEAWFVAFNAISACEAQLKLSSLSESELILPVQEAQQAAHYTGRTPGAIQLRNPSDGIASSGWRLGELEFEAMMRRLDSSGYQTGHVYRMGQIQSTMAGTMRRPLSTIPDGEVDGTQTDAISPTEPLTPRQAAAHVRKTASLGRGLRGMKDVEIPPATSSFASTFYEDDESRAMSAAQARAKTMSLSRTHWLNTPNSYARHDIEEIGTANPKVIAHWTAEEEAAGRTGGMAVPIDDPNQFAPQGADPHEFKRRQRKVKDNYYKGVTSAGPTSRILQGFEADVSDGELTDGAVSPVMSPRGTLLRLDPANPPSLEPGHVVLVGAVSQGIINRKQRHNPGAFQSVYSPNPFDRMTDDDLDRYRENMDRKAKGLPTLEDEEDAARADEARRAAEIAREAMEAASSQPHKSKLRLKPSFRPTAHCQIDPTDLADDEGAAVTATVEYSNTLADVSSSVLYSATTSVCFSETERFPVTRHLSFAFSPKHSDPVYSEAGLQATSQSNLSLDATDSNNACPPVDTNKANSSLDTEHHSPVLIRRHSAFRCWYWPRMQLFRSAQLEGPGMGFQEGNMADRDSPTNPMSGDTLKRAKTAHFARPRDWTMAARAYRSFSAHTMEVGAQNSFEQAPAGNQTLHTPWQSGAVIRFHHTVASRVSPAGAGDSVDSTGNAGLTSQDGDTSRAGQSCTSGADASHDDTEKEQSREPEGDTSDKKKKRRFKMPSFARKSRAAKPKP